MKVLDITLPLSLKTLTYPGDLPPTINKERDIEKGDELTATHLSMNCHVGTHVDAPAHFLGDGETLDELRLERFYGPAVVYELLDRKAITRKDVESLHIRERCHILFKTMNSELLQHKAFSPDYCTLSSEAAEAMCERQPLSIGFDYYSLDPYQSDGESFPAHKTVARAGIPVYVCLNLNDVPPGEYLFSGFPLRLTGSEASPVRATLMQRDQE
ncbi:MAG: cyclase family protein [Nitrospirales bacterium]|nr:cyclase family protein [Nitrospirales bacterium]